jgi:multiple sugar transport system substrate-binding protein
MEYNMERINITALLNRLKGATGPECMLRIAGVCILLIALILALTLPVSGPLRLGSRELVFLQYWDTELPPGTLEGLIREFRELNPGVTVTLDTRPYAQVRETLLNSPVEGRNEGEGAGARADILGIEPRWLAEEAIRDRLEPLLLEGQSAESLSRPLFSSIITLFYNTALLGEAGFDRPPKTQADFERLARAVSSGGRYGLSLSLAEGPYCDIYPWFWAAGLRVFPGGDPAPDFAGRNSAAVLRYLQHLYAEGLITPDVFTKTAREKLDDFSAGRAAMIIAPVSAARELRRAAPEQAISPQAAPGQAALPFDITTVPYPAAYVGKPLFGITSCHAALARTSRHKAESRAFIAFLAERAALLAAAAGAVPGDAAGSYAGSDPLFIKAYSIYEAGEAPEESAFTAFDGGAASESASASNATALDGIITGEIRRLFTEGQSPEDTGAAIKRRRVEAAE